MNDEPEKMVRRNIHLPDPVWGRVGQAAKEQTRREGRTVTRAEWIRAAIEEKLTRERA